MSASQAMVMSPGVELEERNKTKRGEKAVHTLNASHSLTQTASAQKVKVDPGTMSRKEYEAEENNNNK